MNLRLAAVVLAALAGGCAFFWLERAPAPPPRCDELLRRGAQHVRAREWDAAQLVLRHARATCADADADFGRSVRLLLAHAEREPAQQEHLDAAERAITDARFEDAERELDRAGADERQAVLKSRLADASSRATKSVVDRYLARDLDGALDAAAACRSRDCDRLFVRISTMKRRLANATEPDELLVLDVEIAGEVSPNVAGTAAAKRLAADYRRASSCKALGEWACAIVCARAVVSAAPRHLPARDILREGQRKAQELYLVARAVTAKADREPLERQLAAIAGRDPVSCEQQHRATMTERFASQ